MDERHEEFDDWLTKMEASAAKCRCALEEERYVRPRQVLVRTKSSLSTGFKLDHESKDVNDYKRLEAYVDETIRANHLKAVEAKVSEFKEAAGIDVANHAYGFSCQDLAKTFLELGQLTTWLNGVENVPTSRRRRHNGSAARLGYRCWLARGSSPQMVRSEADLVKYDDLAGVSLFVKKSLNEGMLNHLESNIRTNLGIAVPSSVWDHVRRDPHALRSWMDRAVEYQGQCESFRQKRDSGCSTEAKIVAVYL